MLAQFCHSRTTRSKVFCSPHHLQVNSRYLNLESNHPAATPDLSQRSDRPGEASRATTDQDP